MAKSNSSDWLPRVLFESFLIIISILVALGLDEWRGNRADAEMVQQALSNFSSEIKQNQARIDDAAPFNRGLLDVLRNHYEQNDIASVDEFVNMIESYAPVDLQTTAWETALATGSVAKMEYNLVSALSLTYSLQSRYQEATKFGMSDLMSLQSLSGDRLELVVYSSVRYLGDISNMESELSVVYSEASAVIGKYVESADEYSSDSPEKRAEHVLEPQ